jgi:DNA-binding transcriptional MerR regulator
MKEVGEAKNLEEQFIYHTSEDPLEEAKMIQALQETGKSQREIAKLMEKQITSSTAIRLARLSQVEQEAFAGSEGRITEEQVKSYARDQAIEGMDFEILEAPMQLPTKQPPKMFTVKHGKRLTEMDYSIKVRYLLHWQEIMNVIEMVASRQIDNHILGTHSPTAELCEQLLKEILKIEDQEA